MSNIPNNIKKMWEEAASLRSDGEPKPIKGPMPPLNKKKLPPLNNKKPVHPDYDLKNPTGYKYGVPKKDNMNKDM